MRTAVNISPLALARDGRSLRFAHTLHRNHWRVSAVEGVSSNYDEVSLPFPVISLSRDQIQDSTPPNSSQNGIKSRFPGLWQWASLIYFVVQVFIVYPVIGLRKVPFADLYILHEYRWFPAIYLLTKLRGGKILYDAHDFYPLVHKRADLTPFWRRWFRPLLVAIERACVRRACAVTTVNHGIAGLYKRVFGVEAHVLRNLHDRLNDREIKTSLRNLLSLDENVFLLVVVGNQKKSQHFDGLLDALASLPADVAVAFIGRGYQGLPERARLKGLEEGRIHIVGSVDNDQMVPFISDADASLVLYSARSGNDVHFLPNGFFHAVAAGLPVLAPDLRWISRIIEEYGNGFPIDPEDCNSISNGIRQLREMESNDHFKRSVLRAKSELAWNKEAEILNSLADKLVISQVD